MQLQLALLKRVGNPEAAPLIEECERMIEGLRNHIRSLASEQDEPEETPERGDQQLSL